MDTWVLPGLLVVATAVGAVCGAGVEDDGLDVAGGAGTAACPVGADPPAGDSVFSVVLGGATRGWLPFTRG
ncbi:hypothetical protein [Actinomadura formosensis]|uniref:hypothetical protein n=1 Tax=Actinomadura formosensis TaxID=60706 RepID=UPI0013F14496|nr:hypothetical protein [Actinomadura formosensis]